MLEDLKYIKGIKVFKELDTEGHRPLLVLADDYEQYIVKSPNNTKDCSIINEFLCHYFLQCWDIPTPEIAAIKVTKDVLPDKLSVYNKLGLFDKVCFASKFISDAIEVQNFMHFNRKKEFRRIYNPEILFLIALFDVWIENDDRKPTNTNLLLAPYESRLLITAIDHACVFSSVGYNNLNKEFVSSSYNDTILHSELGKTVLKNVKWKSQVEDLRKKFYLCLASCRESYAHICKKIPHELGFLAEEQIIVRDFLFDIERNKKVFNDFLGKLK